MISTQKTPFQPSKNPNETRSFHRITSRSLSRNAVVPASADGPYGGKGRDGGAAVYRRRESPSPTQLDQRRQPASRDRATLLRCRKPAANHRGRRRGRRGNLHVRDVKPVGHRAWERASGHPSQPQLRLGPGGRRGDGVSVGQRAGGGRMDHGGHRDHRSGVLRGGNVSSVGGDHLPHAATQRGLQRHQHRSVPMPFNPLRSGSKMTCLHIIAFVN